MDNPTYICSDIPNDVHSDMSSRSDSARVSIWPQNPSRAQIWQIPVLTQNIAI